MVNRMVILWLVIITIFTMIFCSENGSTILGSSEGKEELLRVMTFNIRYNTSKDGENQWPYRKDIVASMIRFHKADIAGLQEALIDQVNDLDELLPEFGWFGIGRDDGKEAGEFMAIFYKKDRFDIVQQSTFWLSETPDTPTKGWDARCYRIVTWGKFRDKSTGDIFYLFNTHFDHIGVVARIESAKLLVQRIGEIAGSSPVIVTGDFNSIPESDPYHIITNGLIEDPSDELFDSKHIAQYPHHGPNGTETRFLSANLPDNNTIDYIFIKNNVEVVLHGTLSDSFNGRFPSDHMPVLVEVMIK